MRSLALDFGAPVSDVTVTGPTGAPRFDGADYVASRDDVRLTGQLKRIWDVLVDGHWRTLAELHQATGDPEASISAQVRHLRKKRFGAHTIERRHRGEPVQGLYEYRLVRSC